MMVSVSLVGTPYFRSLARFLPAVSSHCTTLSAPSASAAISKRAMSSSLKRMDVFSGVSNLLLRVLISADVQFQDSTLQAGSSRKCPLACLDAVWHSAHHSFRQSCLVPRIRLQQRST